MKIGELSRKTGVSVRMLRYYEAEGLLSPGRTARGYREFAASDEAVVERIRLLGSAGLTLPVIREFLPCSLGRRNAFEPCDELKAKLRAQIRRIEDQRVRLAESRKLLTELLATLEASTP